MRDFRFIAGARRQATASRRPPRGPRPYAAGRGAVWLLVRLLERGALTPNLPILNALSTAEVALLKRSCPGWSLPHDCDDYRRREAEAESLLKAWAEKDGAES